MKINPVNITYIKLPAKRLFKSDKNATQNNNYPLSYNQVQSLKSTCLLGFGKNSFFPVYAIDKDGNAKKYEKRKDIENELNIDGSSISHCLNGKGKRVGDYTFVPARDIEEQNSDGSVDLKADVLQKAVDRFRTHIYAIDSEGKIIRFNSRKEAEEQLNMDGASITHCLNGKVNRVGNYTFLRGTELEKKDENGNYLLDEKQVSEAIKRFKKAVYAFSRDGNLKKFISPKFAEKEYSLTPHSVGDCLKNGAKITTHGYSFAKASDVEMFDDDGNMTLNEKIIDKKISDAKHKKIYAIDKDGNYLVFNSRKEASETLGVDATSITGCLKGKVKHAKGYVFVRANDIEEKNMTEEILRKKIREILDNADMKSKIYAINVKTREKTAFKNGREAAKVLNLDNSSVYKCLRGEAKTSGGYAFVSADISDT